MKKELLQVDTIPNNVKEDTILEITSTNVGYFTHSFFKYPCKFIPHIPRWAIERYTTEGNYVLDPFAGSGTTLVEAVLLNRNALGVDFDKLSQLLSLTKTKLLTNNEIIYIISNYKKLLKKQNGINFILPDIHNIEHWFDIRTINELCILKSNINFEQNFNIKNFLLVCFASLIKKVSNADDTSPKPYVSSRFKKNKILVFEQFEKCVLNNLKVFKDYNSISMGVAEIISEDAKKIISPNYKEMVDLAITSPPYINAFDYVRSLRLENAWLDYSGDTHLSEIKKKQIGTENISSKIFNENVKKTGIHKLDSILEKIFKIDKKRAHIVLNYFMDMQENILSVKELLKPNAHYIIVVGDSVIRNIEVPTHEILVDIAKKNGFILVNTFSYIIKNRYLRIPRADRGGLIKYDWVIDLKKI